MKREDRVRFLTLAGALSLLGLASCAAPDPKDTGTTGGGINIDTTGLTGPSTTEDSGLSIGGGVTIEDPRVDEGVAVRQQSCDDQGNCTCLRLALLGTLDSEADETDTSAFVNWLNGNSDGSATVDMVTTQPQLNAAWLANYDVLVVANVGGWSFSKEEKEAVAAWSAQAGGILAITGFTSAATEAADSSALLAFAGMGFSGTGQADWTASAQGQSVPVYYDGGTVDMRNCLRWTENNQAGNTTPIHFTPQTGPLEPLTFELDYVGAYIGWSVLAPSGSTVIATDPTSNKDMAVAYEYQGKGRILAFGDEWIIFANQWQAKGQPSNQQRDNYNPCYIAASDSFHSVETIYQTKQFWYNAINWVAPPNECKFVVVDDDVIIR